MDYSMMLNGGHAGRTITLGLPGNDKSERCPICGADVGQECMMMKRDIRRSDRQRGGEPPHYIELMKNGTFAGYLLVEERANVSMICVNSGMGAAIDEVNRILRS